uniref:SLC26A/SulP transporter domain-containing protein n=1 Tax=uncultured bacterium contig00009 TaxID=1181501 RepID=A0A806KDZ6_9BACT|nr:hypothetical protein [uncultured bacterium contig00009]
MSRSVLIGLLNGVAIIIIAGQPGNVFGVDAAGENVVLQLLLFFEHMRWPHWPTLLLSAGLAFICVVLMRLANLR